MASTRAVSELIQQIYSPDFAQAFDGVDFEVTVDEEASASVDAVSKEYLGAALQEAISNVDFEGETFEVYFETPQRYISLVAKGKWLFVVAALISVTVVAIFLGVDVAVTILRTILGA